MWPREPQRYSVFSMKFVLNMKVSLHHLPLKAHKDSKNLACAVQGNQHKRTAEFEIVMTGIYKALQDLNPITSLISSATILSSPLLHPHCSLSLRLSSQECPSSRCLCSLLSPFHQLLRKCSTLTEPSPAIFSRTSTSTLPQNCYPLPFRLHFFSCHST